MTFTNEQLEVLAKYEQNFNEVLDQRVARNIGDRASAEIAEIWHSVNHTPFRKYICAQCRYNLLRLVGTAYRKDKAELANKARTAAENQTKEHSRPKRLPRSESRQKKSLNYGEGQS